MAKLFSFRFDVDTHRCVREGVPALVDLGDALDARFTFYVNMGQAVSRPDTLMGPIRRSPGAPSVAAKLPVRRKLGTVGYLEAAVVNPKVGVGSPEVVRAAAAAGHEIGLHGGTNHATWQRGADGWSDARLAREIDVVLPALRVLLPSETVRGFASPGWTSSEMLPPLLKARGFTYMADLHGPAVDGVVEPTSSACISNIRTALTGEPGGVAYLEHLVASGLDEDAVRERFRADLTTAGDRVVAYDHPYFAGIEGLDLVRICVEVARDEGYTVVPVERIVDDAGKGEGC